MTRDLCFLVQYGEFTDWISYGTYTNFIDAIAGANECWLHNDECDEQTIIRITGFPSNTTVHFKQLRDYIDAYYNKVSKSQHVGDDDV